MNIEYNSIKSIIEKAKEKDIAISELVIRDYSKENNIPKEEVYQNMLNRYNIMKQSLIEGLDKNIKSTSMLTGGDAYKMNKYANSGRTICGKFINSAIAKAIAISECNAAMGKIVACPTAGSCGILPAAIITLEQELSISEKDCVNSLFTASAVGMVIAKNASLSGAEGGCQAECGSASAMTAAAITEIMGGDYDMISSSIAIAIKNILGLICDPVIGLVEIPCIKRNASGVAGAFVAAEIALSSIPSYIPADEVIETMKKVGDMMHSSLKETAEGGLASTPTAIKLLHSLNSSSVE